DVGDILPLKAAIIPQMIENPADCAAHGKSRIAFWFQDVNTLQQKHNSAELSSFLRTRAADIEDRRAVHRTCGLSAEVVVAAIGQIPFAHALDQEHIAATPAALRISHFEPCAVRAAARFLQEDADLSALIVVARRTKLCA